MSRICLNLLPFTAKAQWRRDIAAAARLLDRAGEVVVRAPERKLMPAIKRLLVPSFRTVERSGPLELRCADPLASGDPLPADGPPIVHHDPVSARTLTFHIAAGLFSPEAIDPGTQLMLEVLAPRGVLSGQSILDIGCGYGAIGATLAARGATVTLIDSDCRAVKLARHNLRENGLGGEALVGDAAGALPGGPFDLVVSNPPTHAGSEVLQAIFERAARVGRSVLIVVRAHLRYEKWLEPRHEVQNARTSAGYKVLEFSRRS